MVDVDPGFVLPPGVRVINTTIFPDKPDLFRRVGRTGVRLFCYDARDLGTHATQWRVIVTSADDHNTVDKYCASYEEAFELFMDDVVALLV